MVIYKITNKINNKIYIGCAVNYDFRIKQHKTGKFKGATILFKAIQKYGVDNFEFEIIKYCSSKEEMYLDEVFFIKELNSLNPYGYNLHFGGKGGKIQLTPEQQLKRIEHAKSLAVKNIGNKYSLGKKHSDETKLKLSNIHKNKIVSDETKKKMSIASKGNNRCKGIIRSDDYKKKMSEIKKGVVFSEETKKKMALAAKKRCLTSERNNDGTFKKQPKI